MYKNKEEEFKHLLLKYGFIAIRENLISVNGMLKVSWFYGFNPKTKHFDF